MGDGRLGVGESTPPCPSPQKSNIGEFNQAQIQQVLQYLQGERYTWVLRGVYSKHAKQVHCEINVIKKGVIRKVIIIQE